MTNLYIKTPTKADYDALMRLAEAAGYNWRSGCKPTKEHNFDRYGYETVVFMRDNMILEYCDEKYYADNHGATFTTFPHVIDIKAIWRVQPDDYEAFLKGTSYTDPLPSSESAIMLETTNDGLVEGLLAIHKALAVDFVPEKGVVTDKVKLPKFMCDWLDSIDFNSDFPLPKIHTIDNRRDADNDVSHWLVADEERQWLVIDAIRKGYEPEVEQLYCVQFTENDKFGYLNIRLEDGSHKADSIRNDSYFKTQFTMPEIIAIDPRYKAFAIPVEEVDGYAAN